jgi:cell division septum initiation protein DivIVA
MMVRENQMLRQRIRELERQISEMHVNSSITHEPATPSRLMRSESLSEESLAQAQRTAAATAGPSESK